MYSTSQFARSLVASSKSSSTQSSSKSSCASLGNDKRVSSSFVSFKWNQ